MEDFTFDDEYLARLRAGDRETQSHFYGYFQPRLLRVFQQRVRPQFEAEDLCQRVIFVAFNSFASSKGPESGAKVPAWVFGTAKNVLHEFHRWQDKHKSESFDPDQHDRGDGQESALDLLFRKESVRAVRATLAHLPPRDVEIITKLFFEELDKDEICAEMGIERGYLRVLLHRALKRFRGELEDEDDDDPPPG